MRSRRAAPLAPLALTTAPHPAPAATVWRDLIGDTMRTLLAALVALALVCPLDAAANISAFGAGTAVSVGTTATALDDTSVPNGIARHLMVCNLSGNGIVYLGDSTVTILTGLPLKEGSCYSPGERLEPGVQLYAVAAGTQVVRVHEVR